MQYPLISEYIEAILNAEDNFDRLSNLRPVLDDEGNPIMSSGNFAVVFKMTDGKKDYALKCFTREQEGRDEAYKEICKYLSSIESEYIVSTQYFPKELYVKSVHSAETEFPIVLMDWIEGITLNKYIRKYMGNSFELYELCYNFRQLAKWIINQDFAHGSINSDNILIKNDGQIVLVDYDSMYLPSMYGQSAREEGYAVYQHPFKTEPFDKHTDDFSLSIICLSLKLISISYGIQNRFNIENGLLFTKKDLADINKSPIVSYINELICTETDLGFYYSTFIKCYSGNILTPSDFDLPQEKSIDNLLNILSADAYISIDKKKEIGNVLDNGVIYNKEGNAVIGFVTNKDYHDEIFIKEGTIYICDDSFNNCCLPFLRLHLPSTLRYFTPRLVNHTDITLSWDSPWFIYDNGCIYTRDKTECILCFQNKAIIDKNVSIFGINLFQNLTFEKSWPKELVKIRAHAFENARMENILIIPEGVTSIGDSAFHNINSEVVIFPSTLKKLGYNAFKYCNKLTLVEFNANCELAQIEDSTFIGCSNLKKTTFPNNLRIIGKGAFENCYSIESLVLPKSLEVIEDEAFYINLIDLTPLEGITSTKLENIHFPSRLKHIGKYCFKCQTALRKVEFTSTMKCIDSYAFHDCKNLKEISYTTIEKIKEGAFLNCGIDFPLTSGIGEIQPSALTGCSISLNESSNYILESNALYTKGYNTLVYYWGKEETVYIHNGIHRIYPNSFLYIPYTIILPSSYDERFIDAACISPVVVVPPHIPIEGKSGSTILSHEEVFFDEYGVIYTNNKERLLKFPMEIEIQEYNIIDGCMEISQEAFEGGEDCDPEMGPTYYGNSLTKLMIPQSMRVIQDFAFGGCRELMRIEIPNGVEYLGNHIFNGCLCLKSILLPSSLKKVEEYAFPDNFTTLFDKSSGVKLISDCLLSQSNELLWISAHTEELRLPEYVTYKNETCKTYHDCIVTISGVLLWTAPNINRFTFPAGIKEIGGKSFIWNNEIKDLKIPFGVEIIRKEAWESCLQFLDSIYLPSTLRQIEKTNLDKSTIQKETLYRYPREIHIPPRMSRFFTRLLNNNCLNFIEDYCETQ